MVLFIGLLSAVARLFRKAQVRATLKHFSATSPLF
jgi:hypothetical protein